MGGEEEYREDRDSVEQEWEERPLYVTAACTGSNVTMSIWPSQGTLPTVFWLKNRLQNDITLTNIGVQQNVADKGEEELPGGKKGQYKEIKDNRLQNNITLTNIAEHGMDT